MHLTPKPVVQGTGKVFRPRRAPGNPDDPNQEYDDGDYEEEPIEGQQETYNFDVRTGSRSPSPLSLNVSHSCSF
jgi:hypothetical protein